MKISKKVLSLFIALVMIITALPMNTLAALAAASKTPATITVESNSAMPNSTVNVNVIIKDNPGIVGASITVNNTDELTLVDANSGPAFEALSFAKPGSFSNKNTFVWDAETVTADDIKDGVILTLSYKISASAKIDSNYPITVDCEYGDVINAELEPVETKIVNGDITVIDYMPGDVNEDGKISTTDCVYIRRYMTGGYSLTVFNENAADVNADGKINTTDIVMIRRYIVDGCKTDPNGYNVTLKPSTSRHIHTMEAIEKTEATCTEEGNTAYWYCTDCGKYFTDAKGLRETTVDSTIISKKEHTIVVDEAIAATESSTGLTEGSHCSVCGKVIVKQEVIPIIVSNKASITYKLVNNDSYLAGQIIDNPNPNSYVVGKGLTLSNDLNVPGYTFVGWYDSFADNATQIKSISKTEEQDITLYAHWEPYKYKIQYESDLIPVNEDYYTVNQSKTLPTPKISGYSFVGWSDDKGNIIKRIPVGTTGDKTYTANWLSDRNQALTYNNVGEPLIFEEDNKILFAYEVGEIRNVPVSVIHNFGKILGGGVASEQTVTHSKTISNTQIENYAKTVANATTENYGITLANGWSDGMTVSEEYCKQHGLTQEEAKSQATNETNNWYVSSGSSGSSTTTTFDTTDTTNMTTGTKNKSGTGSFGVEGSVSSTHKEESHKDFSFKEKAEASGKIGPVNIGGGFEANQSFGSSESDSTTSTSKANLEKSATVSKGKTQQDGTVSHTGSNTTSTGSWNSESGRGGSSSVTNTVSTSKIISESISEKTGYGKSYIKTGSETSNQGFSSQQSSSDSYSTGITYSTAQSETFTETVSTTNTIEGYHRWVWATTAHVFMIVGYDIATSSYFTCSYSILDDEVKRFEDYSYDTASYDDNQNGVITFEIPTDIKDYVSERMCGSDGLQYSRDGKVTGYTGTDDFVIIPEYKVINGTVIKVTGVSKTAFKDKVNLSNSTDKFLGLELSEFITEIPDDAFNGCSELKYIDLKNVTSIGNRAFSGCYGLKTTKLNDKITHLGENAFENLDAFLIYASNKSVAEAAVKSGAKAIALIISDKCNDIENTSFEVSEGTEFFGFYGSTAEPRTFKDVSIVSNADETLILNANFESTKKVPITISSQTVLWGESNVTAPNFCAVFTAPNTEIAVYGEATFTSQKGDAVLTKNLSLGNVNNELYSQLHMNGNVLVLGDIIDNEYLSFNSGKVIKINENDYQKYIKGCYTIKFDASGGTVAETERTAYYGTQTETLPTPSRDYYTFDGWYTENGLSAVTPETLISNADDITLYAHWTINPLSDWVKASELPANAQVVSNKWSYDLTSTATSTSNTMDGYTLYDTTYTYKTQYRSRTRSKTTVYNYWRYAKQQYGGLTYNYQEIGTNYYSYTSTSELAKYDNYGGGTYKYWYNNGANFFPVLKKPEKQFITYKYGSWGSWSAWSDSKITSSDTRDVSTQQAVATTTYHFTKTEHLESSTEITTDSTISSNQKISNIQEWVQYRVK